MLNLEEKLVKQIDYHSSLIPNHYAAKLSELDLTTAKAVPPGGNWKNVPEWVPSKRLETIRKSFAAGDGSRSTYYGRLRPNAPSYTINTYFGRPGNGCHLHYDYEGGQHRTISQREAARLQSFPDNFIFFGNRSSINQQIGNAVPPLLAYQIAKNIPYKGQFIDLFSGAGGLALGFLWAGWKPIVANDIDSSYLNTYRHNIHSEAIVGDIRDSDIFNKILDTFSSCRNSEPVWVLGGPPCQGFSTAGKRRSLEDERNWLFHQYAEILKLISPAGFLFENVTGLLNMEGGRVFEMVKNTLRPFAKNLIVWKLRSENYAIPQRRTRIIIIGDNTSLLGKNNPPVLTEHPITQMLFDRLLPAPSVLDALSDLPPLLNGEDGSMKNYIHEPLNQYQLLMRGQISPDQYLRFFMK